MTQGAELAMDVRAGDYDRFLCIQLAPTAKRPALYAVTAFYSELAKIAETVSEPMLGHIRLAWWREALEEIGSGKAPRNHPVALALAEQSRDLFPLLFSMIDARAVDLDETLLADEQSWKSYLDGTAGALHRAWALILDPEKAATHGAEILAAARDYAMVGLVRAIPYMAAQGFLRFPQAWLDAYDIQTLAPSAQLPSFVRTLLQETVMAQSRFPRAFLPLKGLSALAQMHMKAIAAQGFDPYALPLAKLRAVWCIFKIKYL